MIRIVFPDNQVPGIVIAYMAGIKVALAISIGGAGFGLVICLFSKWTKLDSETAKETAVVV